MNPFGNVGKLALGSATLVFVGLALFYWHIFFMILGAAFWLVGAWSIGNIICEIACQRRTRK